MVDDVERYPLSGRFLMGRSRHALGEREKDQLESIFDPAVQLDPGTCILSRGELANKSTMLVEGYIVRVIREEGRRDIVGIHVPGDFVDLHSYALRRLDHDVIALGPARVAYAPHDRIGRVHEKEAHLSRILWFSTMLDAAIHRQWILKLEKLKASRRVAHQLAEIWRRLDMVALGRPTGFRSPLSQADLADMCGTTAIHMNRSLSELRREGLAEFRRGMVTVRDRKAFEEFGEFEPSYLYGGGELEVRGDLDP